MTHHRLTYKIISVLLQYPDESVHAALPDITAALPKVHDPDHRRALNDFVNWLKTTNPTQAAQQYVATFDHTRRRSLYLTYYRHGDTRTRGMALLALKHLYRNAGYEPLDTELPDYLPLMLEFAARTPDTGRRALLQCRAGLELLYRALHDTATPHAALVDAVRTSLPALRRGERNDLRSLAHEGPPTEGVGLEPFAGHAFHEQEYR